MICKFEYDEDCCNSGSPQYMCKCKQDVCNSAVLMTNADRIRAMSDEELAKFLNKCEGLGYADSGIAKDKNGCNINMLDWLQQPAKED